MKPGINDNSPQDERWDESDPLFRLLGEAPRPEPGPWFATKTVTRCRQERKPRKSAWLARERLLAIWRWVLGTGVVVSMAMAIMTPHVQTISLVSSTSSPVQHYNVQDAFEIMAALDTDSDYSSSPSWQDSSTY